MTIGTNELIGRDTERLLTRARQILGGDRKRGLIPLLWDGHAAERIAERLTGYPAPHLHPSIS